MTYRAAAATLMTTAFLTELGARVSALALPLVTLLETGSVAATGLIGGMMGIPILASPWWARRLRQRMTGGPVLAVVALVQTLGVLIVPVSLLVGSLDLVALAGSGLVVGAAVSLAGPGQDALLADIADVIAPGGAARMMALRELTRRITIALGPTLGALGVQLVGPAPLLWLEAAALAVAAAMLALVPAAPRRGIETAGLSIRAVLRQTPDLVRGFVLRGTGSLVWFAFSLGLVVLGEAAGAPGLLLAAANGGYGAGTLAGAAAGVAIVRRAPVFATMVVSWTVLGLSFVALGAADSSSYVAVAAVSACAGASMALGIAAITAELARGSEGAERRAAFTGQAVVVESTVALGLVAGGAVIAAIGPRSTLVACGLVLVAMCGGVAAERRLRGPSPTARARRRRARDQRVLSGTSPTPGPGDRRTDAA